ncbi:MAG: ABC transporter permease, partial [Bacteroidales bacterium]|nr:ABC transporter permease [Candidatus Latescibacterota bacterium]
DSRELWIRNGLIVLQFSIAIFLIVGVLTVHGQMSYLQDKALGFEKEQVMVIDNPGALGAGTGTFKDILRDQPGVVSVSGSTTVPGSGFSNIGYRAEGVDAGFTLNMVVCDPEYLDTMKLKMAEGRFFSRAHSTDSTAVVLNSAALDLIGWADPIGKTISNNSDDGNVFSVIGIVEDYHYESLHQEIRPMALFFSGGYYVRTEGYISVRFETGDVAGTVGRVEKAWNDFAPGMPFSYSFLDERFDGLYRNEAQISQLFTIFSYLAIIIGCLGLFGLSAFVVDRKMKEIGIRKVLGASVAGIVRQLNKDFLKVVLVANIFAWPVAWFVMNRWLQNFAYRIDLGIWVFLISGSLVLLIALITVSFQAVKGAVADPVESLKYE